MAELEWAELPDFCAQRPKKPQTRNPGTAASRRWFLEAADDTAVEQNNNDPKVRPAFMGLDIHDVGHPGQRALEAMVCGLMVDAVRFGHRCPEQLPPFARGMRAEAQRPGNLPNRHPLTTTWFTASRLTPVV